MPAERRIGVAELQQHIKNVEQELMVVIENQKNVMRILDHADATLRDVVIELGGAPSNVGLDPGRRSIRRRIHDLENDKSAAQAAAAAVAASKQFYAAAADKRFSKREKMVGLTFGLIVALSPYITLFIHTR